MKTDSKKRNIVAFQRKPVLVLERPVYDLSAKRKEWKSKWQQQGGWQPDEWKKDDRWSAPCVSGVCILNWKPRRPVA